MKNLLCAVVFCVFSAGLSFSEAPAVELTANEQEFIKLLNNYREQHHLPPLEVNEHLQKGARSWAKFHGKSHDVNMTTGQYQGECIAPAADAVTALRMWQHSSGHNKIMTGANYRYVGIGFDGSRAVLRVHSRSIENTPVEPQEEKAVVESKVTRTRKVVKFKKLNWFK
jgi:uncharacterized protein YkwD